MFQPSESDADAPKVPPVETSKNEPRQERLRHVLYGSLKGIDRTIKILHLLGYANPNDWCKPMPTDEPNRWMVIMTKILLIE
ncbi:MAG TPA: hypothetical protein V6D29_02815 [Leptolyngbyaceae cyanobacterium]